MSKANQVTTARFVGAFLDELSRWGVQEVVVSPGSRSTPLAMCAFELASREPERLRVFVDADERSAGFFALGMAKASGRAVALVCTSGTATANYYPAVLEAEASRVPLIVLTGDRPERLQGLGAPQTCDQLNLYGGHVASFRQMPLATDDEAAYALARQAAREAVIAALPSGGTIVKSMRVAGVICGAPVHVNFPFEEPLVPDFEEPLPEPEPEPAAVAEGAPAQDGADGEPCACEAADAADGADAGDDAGDAEEPAADADAADVEDAAEEPAEEEPAEPYDPFAFGRRETHMSGVVCCRPALDTKQASKVGVFMRSGNAVIVAGEGACSTKGDARAVATLASVYGMPAIADPLSGLRSFDEVNVIDNYDTFIGEDGELPDDMMPRVVVRFGRYPVSKRATRMVERALAAGARQIVVDPTQTRDVNASTDLYVPVDAAEFARVMREAFRPLIAEGVPSRKTPQQLFAQRWHEANEAARDVVRSVEDAPSFEGTCVYRLLQAMPTQSCLFAANSLAIRMVDTFYLRRKRVTTVLCNRGLNGIDGTVSAGLGAAYSFKQTTLLVGDVALLHDLNALALQRELLEQGAAGAKVPSVVIVLLNNNGGGIFDTLPQSSQEPYFERLFLAPQDVDFAAVAQAFDVPYARVSGADAFEAVYRASLDVPGISIIEIPVELRGAAERLAPYQSMPEPEPEPEELPEGEEAGDVELAAGPADGGEQPEGAPVA